MTGEWDRASIVRLEAPGFRLLADLIVSTGPQAKASHVDATGARGIAGTTTASSGAVAGHNGLLPLSQSSVSREDRALLATQLVHCAMDTWLGAWLWSLLRRLPPQQSGHSGRSVTRTDQPSDRLAAPGAARGARVVPGARSGAAPAALLASLPFSDDDKALLQREYNAALARNIMLLEATEAAEAALRSAHLPAMRLKGMAMLGREYPDLGARPMVDADLYVDHRKLKVAASVLMGQGWHLTKENPASALLPGHHLHFTRTKPFAATLELHYRLNLWWWWAEPDAQFVVDQAESLVRGARGGQAAGLGEGDSALRPSPELLVTHLAMHFLKHGLGPDLRNLVDIHLVTQSQDFDWDRLLSVARQAHAAVPVASVLFWAHRSMGIPASLPDSLMSFVDGSLPIAGQHRQSGLGLGRPGRVVGHALALPHPGRAVSHRLALRLVPTDEIPPGPGIAARLHSLGHVSHEGRGNIDSMSSGAFVGRDPGTVELLDLRGVFNSSATLALTHALFLGSASRAVASLLSYSWHVAGRQWVNRVLGLWKRR